MKEPRASLPPELLEELAAVGASPAAPPSAEQWQALLGRLAGPRRANPIGRYAQALGHELRTPMTVVIGGTELLLESALDDEQRTAAENVHRSGQRLLSVLNELLGEPRDATPFAELPAGTKLRARVLVVEDNDFNRALIAHALAASGASVETVPSGIDAVAKYATTNYDLVLMDCHMPELDGFETARKLRSLESPREHVPIIGISAGTAEGMRGACLAAGMDDYMEKPFGLGALRERVAHWLARGASAREVAGVPITMPSPKHDGAAPLDPSRLEELAREAGPGLVLELSELFVNDMTRRLAELGQAIQGADRAQELALAHAVKGACGNFGALRMAALAEDMERCLKADADGSLPRIHAELETELRLVRVLLEQRGWFAPLDGAAKTAAPA